MKKILVLVMLFVFCSLCGFSQNDEPNDSQRLIELDSYWAEVSRTISEGDIEGYTATFHEDAVLVTGISNKAYPIVNALARWKKDFDDTKEGKRSSSVEFRFDRRLGDATTAHESGIFFYSYELGDEKGDYYVNFDALLIKDGTWKAMMEYQKSDTTKEDWDKLKK